MLQVLICQLILFFLAFQFQLQHHVTNQFIFYIKTQKFEIVFLYLNMLPLFFVKAL